MSWRRYEHKNMRGGREEEEENLWGKIRSVGNKVSGRCETSIVCKEISYVTTSINPFP